MQSDMAAGKDRQPPTFCDDTLQKLRWGWGNAYRIGWSSGHGWWAQHRDSRGDDIAAESRDAPWAAIFGYYLRNPEPRDYSAPLADA
jgi:hypothetical protein